MKLKEMYPFKTNKQLLFCSAGGIGRRFLEVQQGQDIPFIDKSGESWTLIDVQYFPANPRLKYDDTKEKKGKDQLLEDSENYVEATYPNAEYKTFGNIGRSGMLVVLQNDSQIVKAFLKITLQKRDTGNNPIFWQTSEFAAQTGLVAQTAQMKKAQVPFDPADIIIPGELYTVNGLIDAVEDKIQNTDINDTLKSSASLLLKQVQNNTPKPLPGLAEFRSVIEIKLGEIAAPIALTSGMCSGQYHEAENALLKPQGASWSTITQISFPPKAEKLIDSYIHYGKNKKLGVSSKDSSGGAKPSTATIAQTLIDKEEEFEKDPIFVKNFKNIKDNIILLDQESAINGPIRLAIRFRYITKAEALYLESIYGKGVISDATLRKKSPNLYQLIKSSAYKPDKTNPEYQTGFHILAVLARLVVAHLNRDAKKTTQFMKAVLNKSDIVQVYAKTILKGDAVCYKDFHVVYPPTFSGTIQINADSYTSRTKPSRKIGFEFKK